MSEHFSMRELTFSETAIRHGLLNVPDADEISNLNALCDHVLEPARMALGPIRTTSGYRSRLVNALVGGSPSSQHMQGQAHDGYPINCSLHDYLDWLYGHAPYDQIILEFSAWVHVSFDRHEPGRRALLVARRPPGLGTVYQLAETPEEAFAMAAAV